MSRTILVVDDDRSCRLSLLRLLKLGGYFARGAASGCEAVEHARMMVPAVILMDLQLTGCSGIDIARALRAAPLLETTAIIALTASPPVNADASSLFHAVLLKPCRSSVLFASLERALCH